MQVVKREAVYIPVSELSVKQQDKIKSALHFAFYEDKACNKCEWLEERHTDVCDNCAAFKGSYDLAAPVKVKGTKYLRIPVGSHKKVLKDLDYELVDKSKVHRVKPYKFTGQLRPEQQDAVDAIVKRKRGVLKAPPRSGKTVIGSALACRLGVKTLLLGTQRDWLDGFMETFIGSATQKRMTDLSNKRIGYCKTLEDFEKYDVCLATFQSFYSDKGARVLKAIRDMFTLVIIDEVHTSAAAKAASIVSKINARMILGLSGTPARKDGKYVLVESIIGPVLHEMGSVAMSPTVEAVKSPYSKKYKGQMMWARMVSSLENDKKRIELIAEEAVKDIRNGHLILIPLAQKKPIAAVVKLINEKYGSAVAVEFTGAEAKKRPQLIQDARDYKIKAVVGTQKILSVGVNIPRASMLYELVMSSNLPNAEQRMMRVLTKVEGKPAPVIKFFLDDFDVRRSCMRNEYFGVLYKLKPIISDKVKEIMKAYFSTKKNNDFGGLDD